MITLIGATRSREIAESRRAEFSALILASTLAMCLVASASDLILAFLSLQAMNILPTSWRATASARSCPTEAAVKYMAFSVRCRRALLLYGFAILFPPRTCSTFTRSIRRWSRRRFRREPMLVVFMLTFLGLSFQVGALFRCTSGRRMCWRGRRRRVGVPFVRDAGGGFRGGAAVSDRHVRAAGLQPGQWQVLGGVDWTEIVALVSGASMLFGLLARFSAGSG